MYKIAYAYPSSTFADAVGRRDQGAFVIERVGDFKTGARLKSPVLAREQGFDTREEAEAVMATLPRIVAAALAVAEVTAAGLQLVIPGAEKRQAPAARQLDLLF